MASDGGRLRQSAIHPSASLIAQLRQAGYSVAKGKPLKLDGIAEDELLALLGI